jgi:hypothetical protein
MQRREWKFRVAELNSTTMLLLDIRVCEQKNSSRCRQRRQEASKLRPGFATLAASLEEFRR